MFPFASPLILGVSSSGFDPATSLGTATEGGYYIGNITDGSQIWALIYAPKASGQTSLRWKNSRTTTAGTQSLTNGVANSNAMDNATHPAAQWCQSRVIGGFSDWYLPAKDELSAICDNQNAIAGADAVDRDTIIYWSSTETSAYPTLAWCQDFSSSYQFENQKDAVGRVRAVRRVLIG